MAPNRRILALALFALTAAAWAGPAKRSLIDPFPPRFPLVEAGTAEIVGHIVGQPWARNGVVYGATVEGTLTAVVVPSRSVLWRRPVEGTAAGRSSGIPVTAGRLALQVAGSSLRATDVAGRTIWEFEAQGPISAPASVQDGRVFFGTTERAFYCLRADTGRVRWQRRLQGAPLHPPVVAGGTVIVAASNSVVYWLSAKGGSILSWETVPSRIVYEPAVAGSLVLISSATATLTAFDLRTGKRAGQYEAPGSLVAGAVWSPPFVVVFVEDRDTGRQRIVFLRSR